MTRYYWLSKGAPGQHGAMGAARWRGWERLWPGSRRSEGSEQGRLQPKPQRFCRQAPGNGMEPPCSQQFCAGQLLKYSICAILLGL